MIGQRLAFVLAPGSQEDLLSLTPSLGGLLTKASGHEGMTETLGCRRDGSTFPMEVQHGELVHGERSLTLASMRDISERIAYTESLQHQALHDGLTGLANRTLFGGLVLTALASAKRADEPGAVLVMDLDGFKQVNDTFGRYLQRLPVDELKIDKSFVTGLSIVGDDAVIVRSTIDLAHNLGLIVVAEGVEDEAAKEMLVGYGCDRAQGYFFARPCPADEFIAGLDRSPYVPRMSAAA